MFPWDTPHFLQSQMPTDGTLSLLCSLVQWEDDKTWHVRVWLSVQLFLVVCSLESDSTV